MVLAAKNAKNAKNLGHSPRPQNTFATFATFAAKTNDLIILKGNTMNMGAKFAVLLPLAIAAA